MTLHVAAVYFDNEKKTCGFLLGSDRLGYNIPPSIYAQLQQEPQRHSVKEQYRVLEEKSFFGRQSIGFCSGTFRSGEDYPQEFRTLDNCFDDIDHRARHKEHPFLQKAHSYVLSIVKRSDQTIELYRVYDKTKRGKKRTEIKRDCSIKKSAYTSLERTPYWSALNTHRNPPLGFAPGRCSQNLMLDHLVALMQRAAQERPHYIAGPFDFYAIDFDGIRKVA